MRSNIMNTNYKLNKEQKEAVEARLKSLLEVCQIYHLPMFAAVAIKNTDNETEYSNIIYNGGSHNVSLKDDKIKKHMLVANGFEPVPPREKIEIVADDLFDIEDEQINEQCSETVTKHSSNTEKQTPIINLMDCEGEL